jgi:hypothetical protein
LPKITTPEPPQPSDDLGPWITGDIDFIYEKPSLLDEVEYESEDGTVVTSMKLKDFPNIKNEFDKWMSTWEAWAEKSKDDLDVQRIYSSLFNARDQIRDQSQDWEFVVGIGRLRLGIGTDKEIDRHIFVSPCVIDLDSATGTLFVRVDDESSFRIEDEWIQGFKKPDLPDLEIVRELCDRYGVLLIFDEVKTGLTAGPQGAAQRLGVQPDLICLAKSIGGGLPVAAFGGKREVMATILDGRFMHMGTFNGNPLSMAGVRAMDRIATDEALHGAESLNRQALSRISDVIEEYDLPAHTVGFGIKGCITWSQNPVKNYRDYKATNFGLAELSWLWSINRGIITPPGLDEQWLISLAHSQNEIDLLVNNFAELACALRG